MKEKKISEFTNAELVECVEKQVGLSGSPKYVLAQTELMRRNNEITCKSLKKSRNHFTLTAGLIVATLFVTMMNDLVNGVFFANGRKEYWVAILVFALSMFIFYWVIKESDKLCDD